MGGSNNTAKEPTLALGDMRKLGNFYINNVGDITEATGAASRDESGRNLLFGLDALTRQGETFNSGELSKLRKEQEKADARLRTLEKQLGKAKKTKDKTRIEKQIAELTSASTERSTKIGTLSSDDYASDRLRGTFSEQFGMADDLKGRMGAALDSTSEYDRMQSAFGRGLDARLSDGVRLGSVADVEAGRADRVADISAQQVGGGQLGASLMNRAQAGIDRAGQLSPEAARDAVQAARQGFASRGLATGNAAIGAELLNRDRYSRQREFEDLAFASGVQDQDLNRQQLNFNRALEAQAANQRTGLGLSVANLDALMRSRMANQQTASNMSIAQGNLSQQNNQFNAGQLSANDRFNIGLLEQSAVRSNEEQLRQLGLGQDLYNFAIGTDPRMLAAGLGSPYANLTGAAAAGSNIMGTMSTNPLYSGAQFSGQGGGFNWGNVGAGAASGAIAGSAFGPWGAAGGAVLGGGMAAMG
jgi:hypothetical protein